MTLPQSAPRVIGLEVEHAIAGRRLVTPAETAPPPVATPYMGGMSQPQGPDYTPQELSTWVRDAASSKGNGFLPNGSRFYIDVNSHPEYCSPECTTLEDFLVADRAGSELLAASARAVEAARDVPSEIHIYRNNRNLGAETWGTHENYEVRRAPFGSTAEQTLGGLMAAHFVSRQIYTGVGGVVPNGPNVDARTDVSRRVLCVSPRGMCVNSVYGTSAMNASAPMVKAAGASDTLCTSENFRLQVVCGESNMSEAATALKLGVTRLLISILETDPHRFDDLALANPVKEMVAVASDMSGAHRLTLAQGGTTSALALQRKFLARARAAVRAHEVTKEEAAIITMWASTLEAISHDAPLATKRVDWRCKNTLIQQMARRKNVSVTGNEAVMIGASYHDIVHGLRPILEQRGVLERVTDPVAVEQAVTTPPVGGRPETRGWIVAVLRKVGLDYGGNWDKATFSGTAGYTTIEMPDPRITKDRVAAQLATALANGGLAIPAELALPQTQTRNQQAPGVGLG